MLAAAYPPTRESELWAAAKQGDSRVVNSLLRVGTDPGKHVDVVTGATALHEALTAGHSAVAKAVLASCAPKLLHWPDNDGFTPLLALSAGASAADGDE
eukprot:5662177-Prymnesium_polylepis.1